MNSQGLILLPTKGRPDSFRRYLEACKDTNVTEPHIIILEKSDEKLSEYLEIPLPYGWMVRVYEGGRGACSHHNKVFEEFPERAYYASMADDVLPETWEWDRILADACMPDKVACFDDGIDHTNSRGNIYGVQHFPCHPFIGGDLVRKWGFLVPPGADHHGADQWWYEAGEQVVCADVKIEHLHFSVGKSEFDKTYRERPNSPEERLKYIRFRENYQHFLVPKLTVSCVKWGDKYGAEYVNNLRYMVSRNLSIPHRFICFTDDPDGLDEDIEVGQLPGDLDGWWNKLSLLDQLREGKNIYFDLDTVITGHIDEMARYKGRFACLRDFLRPNGLGTGVMVWNGDNSDIWTEWVAMGKLTQIPSDTWGDQAWVEIARPDADILQDLFPDSFVSYKIHARKWPPNGSKVVCFHGKPDPHEVARGWVGMFWYPGGFSEPVFDPSMIFVNTEDRVIYEQTEQNIRRGLREIKSSKDRGPCSIVGGGPSLEYTFQHLVGDVFALNGAADYLRGNGVDPNYHVVMDSREDNVGFVQNPSAKTKYLIASSVHPAVLDALEGQEVWLWHPDMSGLTDALLGDDAYVVGGGSTVLLRAIVLAYAIGYREFHIFGADSSYEENHHAYPQPLNDGKTPMEVVAVGRVFKSEFWMIRQVNQMQEQVRTYNKKGAVFHFYGDGLMQWVMRHLSTEQEAA